MQVLGSFSMAGSFSQLQRRWLLERPPGFWPSKRGSRSTSGQGLARQRPLRSRGDRLRRWGRRARLGSAGGRRAAWGGRAGGRGPAAAGASVGDASVRASVLRRSPGRLRARVCPGGRLHPGQGPDGSERPLQRSDEPSAGHGPAGRGESPLQASSSSWPGICAGARSQIASSRQLSSAGRSSTAWSRSSSSCWLRSST